MFQKLIEEFGEFDSDFGVSTVYRIFETAAGELIETMVDYGGGFVETFVDGDDE